MTTPDERPPTDPADPSAPVDPPTIERAGLDLDAWLPASARNREPDATPEDSTPNDAPEPVSVAESEPEAALAPEPEAQPEPEPEPEAEAALQPEPEAEPEPEPEAAPEPEPIRAPPAETLWPASPPDPLPPPQALWEPSPPEPELPPIELEALAPPPAAGGVTEDVAEDVAEDAVEPDQPEAAALEASPDPVAATTVPEVFVAPEPTPVVRRVSGARASASTGRRAASVVALLGLSVVVGALVAGLIALALLLAGVALRRAVD